LRRKLFSAIITPLFFCCCPEALRFACKKENMYDTFCTLAKDDNEEETHLKNIQITAFSLLLAFNSFHMHTMNEDVEKKII
jgi:hypothetical protein